MKITAFDALYPGTLGGAGSVLDYSSGSNTADGDVSGGGDVTGSPGDYTVVGLRSAVSLASNIGGGVLGDVLTITQVSPAIAMFATPSNSGATFGSNATRVSEVASVGASANSAREDHIHDGIGTVTASSSNTMQRGTLNLRPGSNITFGLTDGDGDGEFDTITFNGAAAGTGGGGDASGQLAGGFDGGGSAITTGSIYYGVVPFDGTITDWIIQASGSSNAEFDVAVAAAGTRPTFPGDSIVASAPPSMTGDDDAAGSTLTGWTTALTAGQRFAIKFISGTATWAQLILNYSRP